MACFGKASKLFTLLETANARRLTFFIALLLEVAQHFLQGFHFFSK